MTAIARSDLEASLRRWFRGPVSSEEVARLDEAWQQRQQDRLYLNMIERQFDPANRAAEGRAWWEERQQGRHGMVLPITAADMVHMWLTYNPPPGAPRPRPWCPDILVGVWRLVGASKSRGAMSSPPAPREWTLHEDGRLTTAGDRPREGWTWCAHRAIDLDLWLYPPGSSLPRTWAIHRIDSNEMTIFAADEPLGHMRWQRKS